MNSKRPTTGRHSSFLITRSFSSNTRSHTECMPTVDGMFRTIPIQPQDGTQRKREMWVSEVHFVLLGQKADWLLLWWSSGEMRYRLRDKNIILGFMSSISPFMNECEKFFIFFAFVKSSSYSSYIVERGEKFLTNTSFFGERETVNGPSKKLSK